MYQGAVLTARTYASNTTVNQVRLRQQLGSTAVRGCPPPELERCAHSGNCVHIRALSTQSSSGGDAAAAGFATARAVGVDEARERLVEAGVLSSDG
jgi:hypothetical protein